MQDTDENDQVDTKMLEQKLDNELASMRRWLGVCVCICSVVLALYCYFYGQGTRFAFSVFFIGLPSSLVWFFARAPSPFHSLEEKRSRKNLAKATTFLTSAGTLTALILPPF